MKRMVGDKLQNTKHSKIKKINDPFVLFNKLDPELKKLKTLINNDDPSGVKKLLEKFLKSYKSNSNIVESYLFKTKII